MTTVYVTCLCGKNTESLQLKSSLPVPVSTCSCSICRYTTGLLYLSCLPLTSKPKAVANLTEYRSSTWLTRYFCPACGSHMFANNVSKENSWMVCSGSVDQVPGHEQVSRLSLEKVMQHEFVGTTKDGGLALCLADFEGRSAPLFLQDSNGPTMLTAAGPPLSRSERAKPPYSNSGVAAPEGEPGMHTNQLSASCYCGGVAFQVTRPNSASTACSSPFPDLLVPYHSSSSENPTDVKWWLRANKYLAGTCACRSCRLGSGSPIQAWAFIPKANISQRDGSPIDYGIGTLQEIESSKDCFRNFCGTCGATVFWHSRTRPDLVDVSVGLLRAEEGSRAENWLQWWTERVSFQEDALDTVLIDNLQRGLSRIHSNG